MQIRIKLIPYSKRQRWVSSSSCIVIYRRPTNRQVNHRRPGNELTPELILSAPDDLWGCVLLCAECNESTRDLRLRLLSEKGFTSDFPPF